MVARLEGRCGYKDKLNLKNTKKELNELKQRQERRVKAGKDEGVSGGTRGGVDAALVALRE